LRKWINISLLLLICISQHSCQQDQPDAEKYLKVIQGFADTLLEHGRDNYGEVHTALFVDGLDTVSLEPAIWKGKGGETWIMSNFSSQQALMRLLDGLSVVSGDDKYRLAAEDATREVMKSLRTPNGLLYWGGHAAWDLRNNVNVGEYESRYHEIKTHQPYFRLMWRVNPDATRDLMETIWGGHILDWSRLDYNRHASNTEAYDCNWDQEFDYDLEVPFPALGNNLSFCNVTPTLMHSGLALAVLDNNDKALNWSRRLCLRWQQARHSETGLSGGQLSYREMDRAQIALGHVHPEINEAKVIATYHQVARYHKLPLAQMQAGVKLLREGEDFAETGNELIKWASEDLKTYAAYCYDPEKGLFPTRMTNGTLIDWQKSTRGYYIPESFAPAIPDGNLLWAFAMAYRLSHDESHWNVLRSLFKHMGLGELGETDGTGENLDLETSCTDWHIIYALLELFKESGSQPILHQTCRVADNLLEWQTANGLFPRPGRTYARTGDEVPLAILHLVAAIQGKQDLIPDPMLDTSFFHAIYYGKLEPYQQKRDDDRTYDHQVYYGPQ
jgi:pectate lyase